MKILCFIHFLLSLLCFGMVIYKISDGHVYKDSNESELLQTNQDLERSEYCTKLMSKETYVDVIYNFLFHNKNLPMENDCAFSTEFKDKTIENFLNEILKKLKNDKKSLNYRFKKRNIPKLEQYTFNNKNFMNYNISDIIDLLKNLPFEIKETNILSFSLTVQFLEISKACLNSLVSDSENCLNHKYGQVIDDCSLFILPNKQRICYEYTMTEKNLLEILKGFMVNSRKKNSLKTEISFFEEIKKRCTDLNILKSDIDFNDNVSFVHYDKNQIEFTLKDFFSAIIDFCEKLEYKMMHNHNKQNIKFLNKLKKINNQNILYYESKVLEKLLSYYYLDTKKLAKDGKYEKETLIPLEKEEYKKRENLIIRVLKINEWLTDFAKKRF